MKKALLVLVVSVLASCQGVSIKTCEQAHKTMSVLTTKLNNNEEITDLDKKMLTMGLKNFKHAIEESK